MTDYKPDKPQLKYWWIEEATPEPALTWLDKAVVVIAAAVISLLVFYAGYQSFGFLWGLT